MDKMRMESADITDQNIEKIGALFPNVITEAKDENGKLTKAINFELLKQELSKEVIDGDKVYEFTWVGKKAAIVEANKPIRKTLRPCKEESVNWDTTENLYIEGDNLEVLKLLQESYLGKVKMIYIDPPYNTGNDFIYNDDFKQAQDEYDEDSGAINENGDRMFKNTDSNGRFHSDWCSMIYSRLSLARNLLKDDGVIFISIDDNEYDNLKKCCDEVFGAVNFVASFIWKSKSGGANDSGSVAVDHEYILCFAKKISNSTLGLDPYAKPTTSYNEEDEFGKYSLERLDKQNLNYSPAMDYDLIGRDETVYKLQHKNPASPNAIWRWSKTKVEANMDKLVFKNGHVYTKNYATNGSKPRSLLIEDRFGRTRTGSTELRELMDGDYFDNPKPGKLLKALAAIGANKDDIVLDFFSGSATTAHALMQLNSEDSGHRKFIMVQFPEKCDEKSEAYKAGYINICEIGKERIRRAAKKIHEENPDAKFDDGFRVLKVDESNMTDVYYSADTYYQNMLDQLESNIKADRTDLDLLFGCLLEWGLPLSMPYTSENVEGCTVHTYNDGDLVACFNNDIPESVIKEIAKRKPLRAVFRDSGFKGSPEKINVGETFKLLSPDTRVKII